MTKTRHTGIDQLPSGKFRARYRDRDGRQHSATFERVSAAKKWRTAQLAALDAGTHVAPNRVTVAGYARSYTGTLNHRPATRRTVETHLRALDGTLLGAMRLPDVLPSYVRSWLSDVERRYAATTAQKRLGFLRSVFTAATNDRLIGTSPMSGIKTRPHRPPPVKPLTVEQIMRFADAVPDRYAAVILLGAGTGLRLGELLGLRVRDVDFLRREVHVAQQLHRTDHTVSGVLKTEGSARTVPLPARVGEALSVHLAIYGPGPDGLLFGSTTGRSVRHDELQRQVARAVVAAGLPMGTSMVDLRHHFASTVLASGVDVFKVAAALGHSTPRLVISTYGHLIEDEGAQVRAAVDRAWGQASSSVSSSGAGNVR